MRTPGPVRMVVGAPAAVAFGALAAVRRARALHPVGVALDAVLLLDGPGAGRVPELGAPGARREGVVRLSRGGGLPEGWPDVHGVALKLFARRPGGRDQDLLFSSSGRSVVGRRLLSPARSFDGVWATSLTTFEVGGERVVWAALVPAAGPAEAHAPDGAARPLTVEWLRAHPEDAPAIDVSVAAPRGAWERVGTVTLGSPVAPGAEADLAFDPWHDGDGVAPVGLLNTLRDAAYRASRTARRARGA